MAKLTAGQCYGLARGAGLSQTAAAVAAAIAMAESGGVTDAMGDKGLEDATWGPSVGVWQIRSLKAQTGTGQPRDVTRLTDPTFNAASMASISGGGKDFNAWTTFKNGAYKNYYKTDAASALGTAAGGMTDSTVAAAAADAAATGKAASGLTSAWGGDAMAIALKVLGAAAAAGLVIVGAVHTVSK
jgi:hypothetical protein